MPRKKQPKIDWDVFFSKWDVIPGTSGLPHLHKKSRLSPFRDEKQVFVFPSDGEKKPADVVVYNTPKLKWLESLKPEQINSLAAYLAARAKPEQLKRDLEATELVNKKLAKAIIK